MATGNRTDALDDVVVITQDEPGDAFVVSLSRPAAFALVATLTEVRQDELLNVTATLQDATVPRVAAEDWIAAVRQLVEVADALEYLADRLGDDRPEMVLSRDQLSLAATRMAEDGAGMAGHAAKAHVAGAESGRDWAGEREHWEFHAAIGAAILEQIGAIR